MEGKEEERKGKCDPSIGEGGGGGVKRCKKGRMNKERGSGGRATIREKKEGEKERDE